METVFRLKRHLTSFQIMILGFAGVILLGALVLMLPIATVQRIWTPFHDLKRSQMTLQMEYGFYHRAHLLSNTASDFGT